MIEATQLFWFVGAFTFVFGTLIGSFLNVVIYRVPAGLSVVSPASRCGSCETPIAPYDNVPILSWLILGGRCRHCGVSISPRYAVVEGLTGGLAFGVWWRVAGRMLEMTGTMDVAVLGELAPLFFLQFTFVALLVAITFVDLDHFLIPHSLSLPGIVLAIASPWILSGFYGTPDYLGFWPPVTPAVSLAGAIGGFLSIVAIFYLYLAARGIEGIGGGDATLMAFVGGWLGWPSLIFIFFASSLQGVFVAGVSMLLGSGFARDSREIFNDEAPGGEPPDDEARSADVAQADDGVAPVGGAMDEPADPDDRAAERADHSAGVGESNNDGGKLAVPFGPFISLAALEFYFFGPLLPPELTMSYFYF